jgi:prepilin-type processing-associated H-X9-DG protein
MTIMLGEALVDIDTLEPDFAGFDQLVDHWSLGSSGMGNNEMSECLGSTAVAINSVRKKTPYADHKELCYSSRHAGGAQVVFADGHVNFISDSIDLVPWSALGTRDRGEVVANQSD